VSRFGEAFTIIRSLLRDHHCDFQGEYYSADNCQLHPHPARPGGPPLMIGSTSARMLSITAPHLDGWNLWWSHFENSPEGFRREKVTADAALVAAGRDLADVEASAAIFVQLADGAGRQMGSDGAAAIQPIRGTAAEIADQLRAFATAGAAHVQLVLDPITHSSIEWFAEVLADLDRHG
jgi:alkanesulfonate monooxygenase SsuD/methylene tetrahydromethanopterin reductase-like flavin-dependent oxidoreductase (luciferase family)